MTPPPSPLPPEQQMKEMKDWETIAAEEVAFIAGGVRLYRTPEEALRAGYRPEEIVKRGAPTMRGEIERAAVALGENKSRQQERL